MWLAEVWHEESSFLWKNQAETGDQSGFTDPAAADGGNASLIWLCFQQES